jgi:hypothetical protein
VLDRGHSICQANLDHKSTQIRSFFVVVISSSNNRVQQVGQLFMGSFIHWLYDRRGKNRLCIYTSSAGQFYHVNMQAFQCLRAVWRWTLPIVIC